MARRLKLLVKYQKRKDKLKIDRLGVDGSETFAKLRLSYEEIRSFEKNVIFKKYIFQKQPSYYK